MMPPMGSFLGIASFGVAATCLALWWRAIQAVSLGPSRSRILGGFGVAFVLGFAAWWHGPGWVGGAGAALGMLLSGLFLGLAAVSTQAANEPTVRVGGPMLAFSALDDSGERFASETLGGKPYLLKFFRGHW